MGLRSVRKIGTYTLVRGWWLKLTANPLTSLTCEQFYTRLTNLPNSKLPGEFDDFMAAFSEYIDGICPPLPAEL